MGGGGEENGDIQGKRTKKRSVILKGKTCIEKTKKTQAEKGNCRGPKDLEACRWLKGQLGGGSAGEKREGKKTLSSWTIGKGKKVVERQESKGGKPLNEKENVEKKDDTKRKVCSHCPSATAKHRANT